MVSRLLPAAGPRCSTNHCMAGDRHPVGPQIAGDGERLSAFVLHVDARVVLQIRPDTRQIDRNVDAVAAQLVGWADSGQHQQLRRVERASRQDHLSGSPVPAARALACV